MRLRSGLLGLLLLLLPLSLLHADRVKLKDGRVLEGAVRIEGDTVLIETRYGTASVPREEVVSIERGQTREQKYEKRLGEVDTESAKSLRAMAEWCQENAFPHRAKRFEEKANLRELEVSRSLLKPGDAEAHWNLVLWAQKRDLPDETIADLVDRVLAADPDHKEAHHLRGERYWRDAWYKVEEIQEIKHQEFVQEMKAKGLVLYDGTWVDPEKKLRLIDKKRELEHKEQVRREELRNLRAERERIQAEESAAEAERDLARAEAQRVRNESEILIYLRKRVNYLNSRMSNLHTHVERHGCRCNHSD